MHHLSLTAIRYVASGAMRAAGLSDDAAGTVSDRAQNVASALIGHFTDHSQRPPKALTTANDRSWKTLEVALAGDSFWDRCKAVLSHGEDQALASAPPGTRRASSSRLWSEEVERAIPVLVFHALAFSSTDLPLKYRSASTARNATVGGVASGV